MNLRHKSALVGGSSAGIGKASAIGLAKAGANVTLVARNEEKLQAVLAELDTQQQQQHGFVVADFQEPSALEIAIKDRIEQIGAFHILVNNTGGPPGGTALSAEIEAFESAFTQHLKCNHVLVQSVVAGMKDAAYGRIINIISTSVKQPLNNLGVSNTIRGAVANWSKTLANELGPSGITVNNVLPGATATGRLSSIIANKAKKTGLSIEAVEESMRGEIQLGRFADPSEIANAVVFLASPDASYINGVNLPVDGGRTKSL